MLNVLEALMCFVTIVTTYNEPLASVNGVSDDDGYDIDGCGAYLEGKFPPKLEGQFPPTSSGCGGSFEIFTTRNF